MNEISLRVNDPEDEKQRPLEFDDSAPQRQLPEPLPEVEAAS